MSELIIGGRRPRFGGRARTAIVTVALLTAFYIVTLLIFRRLVAYPTPDVNVSEERIVTELSSAAIKLRFGRASAEFLGGLIVLRSGGTPAEVGSARGRLLARQLGRVQRQLGATIQRAVGSSGLFSGLTHGVRLRWRFRLLDDAMAGHHLVEARAVAEGAKRSRVAVDYEALVRTLSALDIGQPDGSSRGNGHRSVTRSLTGIVSLADTSGDRFLLGHQLSLDGVVGAVPERVVSFIKPDDAIAYVTVGWAGAGGAITGMNAEGVAVLVHPSRSAEVRLARSAPPAPLVAKDILASSHTLEEAIEILKKTPTLGTSVFVIASGRSRTAMVVERSQERALINQVHSGAVVSDLLTGKPFREDSENDRRRRRRPEEIRRKRFRSLLRSAPPSQVGDLAAILRDRIGPNGTELPLGHRGAIADVVAQHAVILDPAGMALWVSEGPGPFGRFRAFDVRFELTGKGDGPAPPADIPADPAVRLSSVARLEQAQRLLEDAARARSGGENRRASELAESALARAPNYPEALLAAAELAERTGRGEDAQRLYRAYLAAPPDNMDAAEQVQSKVGK